MNTSYPQSRKVVQALRFFHRFTIASLFLALGACATKAPAPPEPVKPIAKITLLPLTYSGSNIGGYASNPNPAPIYVPPPTHPYRMSATDVGAGILVAGVATIVSNQVEKSRARLERAVSAMQFHPRDIVTQRLEPGLKNKGVQIETETDNDIVVAARFARDYTNLKPKADAVLEVSFGEVGYFHSLRAGGWSPMLGMTAMLTSVETGETIDSFSYWSDWRENKKDPRWVTSPPSMIFSSVEELEANAATARDGMEKILGQMIDQLIEDVRLRSQGQAVN